MRGMSRGRGLGLVVGLTFAFVIACNGASGESAGAASSAAMSGTATLRPGEVIELAVTDGVAGTTLLPSGANAQYVVIVASTRFDASDDQLAWSLDTTSA